MNVNGVAGDQDRFRVMACGHRDVGLEQADITLLTRRIGETLDTISGLSQGSPAIIVSLAEGADRLFVIEALAREWPFVAVLPFSEDEFERDFESAASRRDYQTLLARAEHVIEPPGIRGDVSDGAAYAAANQVMLDQAELLLTVWDGEPARGPGGTAEVVAQARARGIPVVWIESRPPHGIRLLDPEDGREPAEWWRRLTAGGPGVRG